MLRGKFFDGISARSTPVTVHIGSSHLEIYNEMHDRMREWAIADLRRDPDQIAGTFVFSVQDPEARLELLDLEAIERLNLRRPEIGDHRDPAINQKILIGIALVIGCIGFLYLNLNLIARVIAVRIPIEVEKKAGSVLDINSYFPLCPSSPSQEKAMDKLVKALYPIYPDDKIEIRVRIAKASEVNAFTLLGGDIVVFQGLLKEAKSAEEIAGVLAHEIEHVKRRHVAQSVVRSVVLVAAINFVSGDISGLLAVDPGTLAQLAQLKYDRGRETEADEGAIRRLLFVGINPAGFKEFFERMEKTHPDMKSLAFLSNHPLTKDRIKIFNEHPFDPKTEKPLLTPEEFGILKFGCI
jgi:Zn-dependent protease with chaperone function